MNYVAKLFRNFKSQPDVWFFYGFLLTFTLSVRKVLFFYPIKGNFNEWTGIYLYSSDILLAVVLFLWGISILRNRSATLSIGNAKLWLKKSIIFLPLLLVFWSFASILWSEGQNIALFKAIKLLELCLLYFYIIYQVVSRETFLKNTFCLMVILGFIQATIGIGQFILQHSIGLFWLRESLISPDIAGVAKIMLNGEKFIRAYGLFPHPNILGGFLLLSIVTTLAIRHSFNKKWIFNALLGFQVLALFSTFSKSAVLGLVIALIYFVWKTGGRLRSGGTDVPRETLCKTNAKQLLTGLIILVLLAYIGFNVLGLDFGENLNKSYSDRVGQLKVWSSVAQDSLLLGAGAGSYMFHVEHNFPGLEAWQYQPIHNVFLLILDELGLVGVFVFVLFLGRLLQSQRLSRPANFSNVPRGTFEKNEANTKQSSRDPIQTPFKSILLGLIFIMLFDHYLWDIQSGQVLFWIVLGIIAGLKNLETKLPKTG